MAQIFYFLGHEQFQPEVLVRHAKIAQEAGFDGVLVSEHFHPWVEDLGASGFAFSTLGAIAAVTDSIKLMTGVVSPLFRYHPALVAQAGATIDRISNGRFLLGIGTGESINEAPLGYVFPKYKERSERLVEAVTIMERLLSGEKVTFDGNFYSTKNAKLYSPPFSNVPILISAGGPKSAVLAAEIADGLIVSVKDIASALDSIINPFRENTQVKKTIASTRWSVYAKTEIEAWNALGAWRGLRAPSRDHATDPRQLENEVDNMSRSEILSRYTIISGMQGYIDAYSPLITKLKSDIVVIQTTAASNQEELILELGRNVLPKLKRLK